MKNLFLVAMLLGLLMAAAPYAGWESLSWKSQNPYILQTCGQEVWLGSKLHTSLLTLELDSLNGEEFGTTPIWKDIDNAKSETGLAVNARMNCDNVLAIKDPLTLSICTGIGMSAGQLGTMVTCAGGREIFCSLILGDYLNQSCAVYGVHWTTVMIDAKKSLETTAGTFETLLTQAETSVARVTDAGLCDDDYAGRAKPSCRAAQAELMTVQNMSNAFVNYRNQFYVQSWKEIPDLNGYASRIREVWLVAIPLANKSKIDAAEALQEAQDDYAETKVSVIAKLAETGKAVGELAAQKPDLITESLVSEESAGTISQRYTLLEKKLQSAAEEEKNAETVYNSKITGYLKNAVQGMASALQKTSETKIEAKNLLDDAKTVFETAKKDAETEINDAAAVMGIQPDPTAKAALEKAQAELQAGNNADTLGQGYAHYALAASLARSAKNYQSEGRTGMLALLKTEMEKTDTMLKNAAKDRLGLEEMTNEFYAYRAEYNKELADGIDASWMFGELKTMQSSIVAAARARYSYLEKDRTQLLEMIGLSQEVNYDLIGEMTKAEEGAVSGNSIDYENGLGKLSVLSDNYVRIQGEINKNAQTVVAGALAKNSYLALETEDVKLDLPSKLTATLMIYNRYGYGAKNVKVELPSALEFLENDIRDGAEFVSSAYYNQGKVGLVLNEVKPYDSYRVVFQRDMILAPVFSDDSTVIGKADGTAEVTRKIKFQTNYDQLAVFVPEEFTSWEIDGKTNFGRKTGQLTKGQHNLEGKATIQNAYLMNQVDFRAIPVGPNSEVTYDLMLMPQIDMNKVEVVINDASAGFEDVTAFQVTSYSAQVSVTDRKPLGNGMYSFSLGAVQKNTNITLRVSYSVARSADYAQEKITELEHANLSPEAQELVTAAKLALASGDVRRAVENAELASAELDKQKRAAENEKNKRATAQAKATAELDEINSAATSGVSTDLLAKLTARKKVLEHATTWDSSALDNYDASWLKKTITDERKTLMEHYVKLKKDYLDSTGGIADNGTFVALENSLSALDASGSLEDLLRSNALLQEAKIKVDASLKNSGVEYDVLLAEARDLTTAMDSLIGDYSKQYEDSRGTSAAAFLDLDYKPAQKETKALQNLVDKSAGRGELLSKVQSIQKTHDQLWTKYNYLKNESIRKLNSVKTIYSEKKTKMKEDDRKLVEQGIVKYEQQVNAGSYADGLKTGDTLVSIINRDNAGLDNLILLGAGALFVLAVLVYYLMKNTKPKEKRMPRRLRGADE